MDTHLGFVVIFKIMRPSPLPSFSLFWWWPDNMANVYGCIICLWMSTFEPSVDSFPSCRFSYGFLSFFYNSSGPAIIFDEFFEARVGWRFKVSVKEFHLGFCFLVVLLFSLWLKEINLSLGIGLIHWMCHIEGPRERLIHCLWLTRILPNAP